MLDAQREGFLSGCRPFIGLDCCFLKTMFGDQLVSVFGRDANNNFYPICMAVVELKNKDSWSWFLENLMMAIGPLEGYTFISDIQKGLLEAYRDIVPSAHHRFCAHHLYANFRDAGFKGKALKDELWGAATACSRPEFDLRMSAIQKLSPGAYDYLKEVSYSSWSQHAFSPICKCDLVVNNLTGSFNSYILDAREKPIITMVEQIRTMLMIRYHKKREGIGKLNQEIPPKDSG